MHLTKVKIENFRGLKNISFDLPTRVNVIVGPNAVGKSSILESIRLVKAVLAPSFREETTQVLSSLGAFIQPLNLVNIEAIAGDIENVVTISLAIKLSQDELNGIKRNLTRLAQIRLLNLLGASNVDPELALVQYLSSNEGQEKFQQTLSEVNESYKNIENDSIELLLEINSQTGEIKGKNIFHQEIVTTIVRSLPPSKSLFSYFPADRALPSGEVNINLGAGDAQQQLFSHIGSPSIKYQRLKQHLVNQSLASHSGENDLKSDFAIIFDKLLTGKELADVTLSPLSLLSVRIREKGTSIIYDLDNMSSGEKGLLLTFFLMKRSVANGGVILLDEPELHLNPAVCKKIIPFLIEEVLNPLNIQAVICTHSPEILAAAYEHQDCTLLHLRTGKDISPIYPQDKQEVFEALKRLGAKPSDILFSKGSIYVEGEHDEDLLAIGWADQVTGYKLTKLGGRGEIEKEIKTLQKAEKEGQLDNIQCFIFDNDRKKTDLVSSDLVKIHQWERYCLENFLLDADAIYDACQTLSFKNVSSRGEIKNKLEEIALSELPQVIAREVYKKLEPDNPGYRNDLDKVKLFEEIGNKLLERLEKIKVELSKIDSSTWVNEFKDKCEEKAKLLTTEWKDKWHILSNGKKVLDELHKQLGATCNKLDFKRQIVIQMKLNSTETWRIVDSVLSSLIEK